MYYVIETNIRSQFYMQLATYENRTYENRTMASPTDDSHTISINRPHIYSPDSYGALAERKEEGTEKKVVREKSGESEEW